MQSEIEKPVTVECSIVQWQGQGSNRWLLLDTAPPLKVGSFFKISRIFHKKEQRLLNFICRSKEKKAVNLCA